MELFSSLKSLGFTPKDSSLDAPVTWFHSIEYHISTILEKINSIDTLNEAEIKNIISRQHSMILNYDLFLKSDETRTCAQKLFTNKRFLEILSQIISLIYLSDEEIICANKLAYDYYRTENRDPEISKLLMEISFQINNILVIRLSAVVGMDAAKLLSMISNSSFKEEKRVHRVNTFLTKCNLNLSVQDFIDIYCIIFDKFRYVFVYTMLESKPNNLLPHQNRSFDNISLAMLAMLDSLTSADIKTVLYEYAYTLKLMKSDYIVRFALKTATTYPRILKVIEDIENDGFDDLRIP